MEEYKRHKDEGISFTIREAKWVARLSVTQCSKTLPYLIARTELLYELIGRKPDFEIFDRLLAGLPGQADNWQVPFMASASLAAVLKDDPIKEYNLRREVQNERKHKTKKQK